jgi:hypothetical protein
VPLVRARARGRGISRPRTGGAFLVARPAPLSNGAKMVTAGSSATDREMTLSEVAAAMGISRQRVQQIEVQALAKVRLALADRGIDAAAFLDCWRAVEAAGRSRLDR